jgi:hypothetical protein
MLFKKKSFLATFVGATTLLRASLPPLVLVLINHQSFYTGNAATGRYSIKAATQLSSRG